MLDYQTCLALKKAGFPQEGSNFVWVRTKRDSEWQHIFQRDNCLLTSNAGYTKEGEIPTSFVSECWGGNEYSNDDEVVEIVSAPSLSDLLGELGQQFGSLSSYPPEWIAYGAGVIVKGSSPEAVLAALYLKLKS